MKMEDQRIKMVERQIAGRGIKDEKLIEVMKKVPRHLFVPLEIRHLAYQDSPLSIGEGQTISQPYMVAIMVELMEIRGSDKILEIGTGSGYQTAILAEMGAEVYTVERIPSLAIQAENLLKDLGYKIEYKIGDGSTGWKDKGEFDKIIVSAASPDIPGSLIDQLAEGGILVIPAGDRLIQNLIKIEKNHNGITRTHHGGCAFVPLIGAEGW
jgi:protein-L-isoaspartate(D-aspartate) O-methyltransferase